MWLALQGDKAGDQLLVVTGPPNHPFISDEDLAEVEFFAEVLGDETCKLVAPSGALHVQCCIALGCIAL